MIGKIFLGRSWHWALLAAAAGLLWYCGAKRLHVIEFNLFILAMLAGTAACIFAIVKFHREGEQVTRDALVADDIDPDDYAPPVRD